MLHMSSSTLAFTTRQPYNSTLEHPQLHAVVEKIWRHADGQADEVPKISRQECGEVVKIATQERISERTEAIEVPKTLCRESAEIAKGGCGRT